MEFLESIEELLEAPEGARYQFKEAKTQFPFDKALKCCSALANGGGGKFILGVTDKRPRKVVGSTAFEQPERTCETLMDKLCVPVTFQIYNTPEGKRVLVFEIASRPKGLPVQVDGIAWCYEGDSHRPMSQPELRRIYNETGHDFSGDICPGATIQDLAKEAIEAFRIKWSEKSGNTRILTVSIEQLLMDCEAITDDGVTYAALILFGTRLALGKYLPQAEIVFEYRSSEASGPAQKRENFRVGFFSCYDQIWELINHRNDMQHYQDGLFVSDIPTFNERVIREALLNAVSHRNYQMAGNVFVRQHPSKLIIESPGGFPIGVTLSNILDRHTPRNRRVAEILALCGLVERSGQGINLIYELSIKEAKALPDFTGTDEDFVCIKLDGIVLDQRMLLLISKIGHERLERLTTADFLLINALFHEQKLDETLLSRTSALIDAGIIERISRNKYVLARSLYAVIGKTGVHTRQRGLDRAQNKALLVQHLLHNGLSGAKMIELSQVLPGHSRHQIQKILNELKAEGKVTLDGKTSGATWFAADSIL